MISDKFHTTEVEVNYLSFIFFPKRIDLFYLSCPNLLW